jgi:hypothetical protein
MGVMNDVKTFKSPMSRYNVTGDKLTNLSLIKGDISPQAYDISMNDVGINRMKELGWLPAKVKSDTPKPKIVYSPKKHYVYVEWVGINNTDMPNISSSSTVSYSATDIYYDTLNAGLFGFKTVKDATGAVISKIAVFFSLNDYTIKDLGQLPAGLDTTASNYVGYVNGAYILYFYSGTYVSFKLDGTVHTLNGYGRYFTALGDDGCIAIEDMFNTETTIFQNDLTIKDVTKDIFSGSYCKVLGGLYASNPTQYKFGTKIDKTYYFLRDDTSSYAYKNTKYGWKLSIKDKPIWKFGKRIKYDYATDNWLHTPLKTLKYNMIKQSLFVLNRMPKHTNTDEIVYPNSDMYGDFCKVVHSDGTETFYHTFDFKKWSQLTGEAIKYLYGCSGRVWTTKRTDGIRGFMPYAIGLKTISNLNNGYKTVLQFSGFIFRG